MLVKVPQITRILSNRSVAGLQARMFRSEVLSGTVAVAYLSQQRLALAAYAELFFLLAQNLIILFLIAYYAERPEGVTAWRGVAANVPAIVAYAVVAARSPPESCRARTSRLLITAPPPCSSRAARRKFWPIIARVRRGVILRHAGAHVRRVRGAHIHDGAGGGLRVRRGRVRSVGGDELDHPRADGGV